jgi:hypothetical protein
MNYKYCNCFDGAIFNRDTFIQNLTFISVTCEEMMTPANGYRNNFTDGLFSYIEFSCISGYHLVGNSVIQCQTDGSWNGSLPACGKLRNN